MINTILLIVFFLTVTLSLGGGLFEVLVIYPNWRHAADADDLLHKLETSGQNNAGKHFWPIVSPAQGLLSIVNIIVAWNYTGAAHGYWLAAAVAIFITRVVTFAYFIPTMLNKIMKPHTVEHGRLKGIIKQWVNLSPLRLAPELFAWVMTVIALMYL
jgi:hypothetical protein